MSQISRIFDTSRSYFCNHTSTSIGSYFDACKNINKCTFLLSPPQLGVALDETVTPSDMADLMWMFGTSRVVQDSIINSPPAEDTEGVIPGTAFERTSQFLQHSVFNS